MEREGEGTIFSIDRKIFSSDIWFDSPWKLKIWIYLIGNANHKPGNFMGIEIKRGQLIRGYRTIRKDCGYKVGYRMKYPSLDTVRRVCEDLTKTQRIVRRTVQCGTLITICNYDKLQLTPGYRTDQRKPDGPFNGRTMTVHNNNDNNNNKKTYKQIPDFILSEKKINQKAFNEFYDFRIQQKKPMAGKAFKIAYNILIKYNHEDQQKIIDRSIMSNWTGLFDLKSGGGYSGSSNYEWRPGDGPNPNTSKYLDPQTAAYYKSVGYPYKNFINPDTGETWGEIEKKMKERLSRVHLKLRNRS